MGTNIDQGEKALSQGPGPLSVSTKGWPVLLLLSSSSPFLSFILFQMILSQFFRVQMSGISWMHPARSFSPGMWEPRAYHYFFLSLLFHSKNDWRVCIVGYRIVQLGGV